MATKKFSKTYRIPASARQRGVHRAMRLLERLESSMALRAACDPGCEEEGFGKPMRNVLREELLALIGNEEALEGFSLVLSGYLAMLFEGTPFIGAMRDMFNERETFERRAASARADASLQRFLESPSSPAYH